MEIEPFSRRMIELLPQLIRGIARHEHNSLSRGAITLPQLWALEYLSRQRDCPMHALARFLGISRPAATGLITRLIAQRLVRREHDAGDRRIVRVQITAKGRRIVTSIWEQKRRAVVQVFGRISPADRARYLRILERVVQTLAQPATSRPGTTAP